MIGLAFASLLTWTVGVAKFLEIAGATARLRGALRILSSTPTLNDAVRQIGQRGGPGAALARAASEEVRLSSGALANASADGLKERVTSRLSRIQAQAGRRHHAWNGRARHDRCDRAVRRPVRNGLGHHEFVHRHLGGADHQSRGCRARHRRGAARDRVGLVAAIPAVVIYNVFARVIAGYRQGWPMPPRASSAWSAETWTMVSPRRAGSHAAQLAAAAE